MKGEEKMEKLNFSVKIAVIVGIFILISIPLSAVAWQETEISKYVPLPRDINIIPPSPELPKEIATFSGRWEGIWEQNVLNWILIVERIDGEKAYIISAFGDAPKWYLKKDYNRLKAKIITGQKPKMEFFSGQKKFTVEPTEDPKVIKAEMEIRGTRYKLNMQKIED